MHGEADSVQCARDLTLAKGLTEEEAVRRLKRWYVAGLSDESWPLASLRSKHKSLRGMLLRDFADSSEWSKLSTTDIDELIRGATPVAPSAASASGLVR